MWSILRIRPLSLARTSPASSPLGTSLGTHWGYMMRLIGFKLVRWELCDLVISSKVQIRPLSHDFIVPVHYGVIAPGRVLERVKSRNKNRPGDRVRTASGSARWSMRFRCVCIPAPSAQCTTGHLPQRMEAWCGGDFAGCLGTGKPKFTVEKMHNAPRVRAQRDSQGRAAWHAGA